ncbi:MAG: tripartite tricarboxylate transporter permease [Proteobacteria bacterium]|nr:tripartite tricarboxylate transporter permease [Pseudomonadota bacterium]
MEFLNYMGAVFTPFNFFVLCLGTAGGLILGALPGLSPTMAVALLIPFTFHMEPAAGLILLGAAYTATVAGGAVSAILLKIPGAPANIATVLDGHAMARNGQAAKALQLCFISSGIGGVLGIFVLIFFTPILAKWALAFGPSHLFWMAMLGVTVIASLGSRSAVKGLISGCIGLWISTIGYDQIEGVERFTFTEHLTGGIHTIAALVGLFAVPQVLQMIERRGGGGEVLAMEQHPVWQTVKFVFGRIRAISIGSIVGIIVGLIPGAGGQIAGLVSYDQTRKFSKNPDNFGKGEPDGVIAAETANNAMVGPSLVPLLTLSVPGSPTAAVLLGGLLIHGIFPGPDLFIDYPEVSWTFINSLLIGQLLMVVFGLALSRLAAKVIRLPENYLAATVMVLAVFGTYSVQHSYSDVLVMATLGVGMYLFEKFGYTAAPIVLGIVLGPIAERNFAQGRIIANAGDGMAPYFLSGGLNLTLIALIVLSITSSVYFEIRSRKQKEVSHA